MRPSPPDRSWSRRARARTSTLQAATYYDAADQAGISRLYGGIHISADDFGGRQHGLAVRPRGLGPRPALLRRHARALKRPVHRFGLVLTDGGWQLLAAIPT